MKYKRILVSERGGPEGMAVVEDDLVAPRRPGEVRVRVEAASVSLPDVEGRYGRSPFPPPLPFTPGYAIVGCVEALGSGITQAQAGDRVAALLGYGGYAEYVYVTEAKLIPVPRLSIPLGSSR